MIIAPLVDVVSMAALALVSVGLWTLRVALTARGRSLATTAEQPTAAPDRHLGVPI